MDATKQRSQAAAVSNADHLLPSNPRTPAIIAKQFYAFVPGACDLDGVSENLALSILTKRSDKRVTGRSAYIAWSAHCWRSPSPHTASQQLTNLSTTPPHTMAASKVFLVIALALLVVCVQQPAEARELRGVQDVFVADCERYGELPCKHQPSTAVQLLTV